MKIYPFPSPSAPHIAFIKERPRNSGLTSLRFVAHNRIICCDFNEKRMYLAEFNDTQVRIIAMIPTIVQDGTPVQTDLLDVNDDGLVVVSNFYQGSQSFYRLEGNKLTFVEEIRPHNFKGCHGVRFIPGYDDLLLVAYCGHMNKYIDIVNYKEKKVLHHLLMSEQLQDAAFIGNYLIMPARTNHISVTGPNASNMYATVYLFRMPENLYQSPPELIDTWHGEGHLDAMIEHGDQVYSANQYTDEIDVFGISPQEKIEKRSSIKGFTMPHGLDIRDDGLMAVTNYGDNSLRFMQLATAALNVPIAVNK